MGGAVGDSGKLFTLLNVVCGSHMVPEAELDSDE
jgi:hypothetical protein